jgi:hypothetical protein
MMGFNHDHQLGVSRINIHIYISLSISILGTSGTSPTKYKVMAGAYPPLKGDGSWGLSPGFFH